MLVKTRGIVIKKIRHRESSLIVHILTKDLGIQHYIVNGVFKKNPSFSPSLLELSMVLELVVYHKENQSLKRLKEAKSLWPMPEPLSNMSRSAVKMFIVEILNQISPYSDEDGSWYNFVESLIEEIDHDKFPLKNIPIYFMMACIEHIGIQADLSGSSNMKFLDLKRGCLVAQQTNGNFYMGPMIISVWKAFYEQSRIDFLSHTLKKNLRFQILEALIRYAQYHTNQFNEIVTIQIYRQIL